MSELVLLLEEPSAKAMLEGLLPRLLPDNLGIAVRYIVFEGKRDLEAQVERRLRSYRVPDARFLVLRDKDSGDCREIKANLLQKCRNSGRVHALVRIACHELESWYLADLAAVEQGLRIPRLSEKQGKERYRRPDALAHPARELTRLTEGRYQKVSGSRAIGPLLDLANRRSPSFAVLVAGLRRLLDQLRDG